MVTAIAGSPGTQPPNTIKVSASGIGSGRDAESA